MARKRPDRNDFLRIPELQLMLSKSYCHHVVVVLHPGDRGNIVAMGLAVQQQLNFAGFVVPNIDGLL